MKIDDFCKFRHPLFHRDNIRDLELIKRNVRKTVRSFNNSQVSDHDQDYKSLNKRVLSYKNNFKVLSGELNKLRAENEELQRAIETKKEAKKINIVAKLLFIIKTLLNQPKRELIEKLKTDLENFRDILPVSMTLFENSLPINNLTDTEHQSFNPLEYQKIIDPVIELIKTQEITEQTIEQKVDQHPASHRTIHRCPECEDYIKTEDNNSQAIVSTISQPMQASIPKILVKGVYECNNGLEYIKSHRDNISCDNVSALSIGQQCLSRSSLNPRQDSEIYRSQRFEY